MNPLAQNPPSKF